MFGYFRMVVLLPVGPHFFGCQVQGGSMTISDSFLEGVVFGVFLKNRFAVFFL